MEAPAFGLRLRVEIQLDATQAVPPRTATLRNWRPGDRVYLRHSSGPRRVKEVLERMRVTGTSRAVWPVLELEGKIVWMQGAEVEPQQGVAVFASLLAPVA
jgi:tRNA(Ile)-lysidine synthase